MWTVWLTNPVNITISMNIKKILIYLLYFVPVSAIILSIWYFFVDGVLYYCSDKVPVIDFIPPFVHPDAGDYFIASPFVIYLAWIGFIVIAICLSLFLVKKFHKNRFKISRKGSRGKKVARPDNS